MSLEQELDLESVNVEIKKKYLELFKDICEENELDAEKELKARLEQALVDSFNKFHSRTLHQNRALRFLKGGKCHKRKPGFEIAQIEKVLAKMDTVDEKIDWLQNFRRQLQQTKQSMYVGRGLPTVMTKEEQYTSLTPYIQTYPQAIKEIHKKICELEAQKIVEAEVIHKM